MVARYEQLGAGHDLAGFVAIDPVQLVGPPAAVLGGLVAEPAARNCRPCGDRGEGGRDRLFYGHRATSHYNAAAAQRAICRAHSCTRT